MISPQNESNNLDKTNTTIIAPSEIFSVEGDKLCIESKEIQGHILYTIKWPL